VSALDREASAIEETVKSTMIALGSILLSSALLAQPRDSHATSATSHNVATEYRFAEIAWGASADSVKAALQRDGLRYVSTDSLGDLTFVGRVVQRNAAVIATMHDGRLVRTVVGFEKSPRASLPLYRTIKRELVAKYGTPKLNTEVFLPPYYEGDGNEDGAFLTKKAQFISLWRSSANGEKLTLFVDERPGVMVIYAAPDWAAEEARRSAKR
jgi:hypothetical protein